MPRSTLILDSSQISTHFECAQKHTHKYVESIVQIEMPDAPEAKTAAGTLGHKLLEIYYTELSLRNDPAMAAALALSFDPSEADKVDSGFPLTPELQAKVFARFRDYLMFWSGREYEILSRPRLRTVADGGILKDIFVPEPLIEQGFSYELLNTKEYLFVLEGRIDFMGETHGERFWMDHKWQLRRRELYKKSIQFRNYALATNLSLGIINYVRLADKMDNSTFVRQPIMFSAREMYEWRQELTQHYVDIVKSVERYGTEWRIEKLNRDSCSGKYGYPCEYTKICEEYNRETREAIKASNFKKRKVWTPWLIFMLMGGLLQLMMKIWTGVNPIGGA